MACRPSELAAFTTLEIKDCKRGTLMLVPVGTLNDAPMMSPPGSIETFCVAEFLGDRLSCLSPPELEVSPFWSAVPCSNKEQIGVSRVSYSFRVN